MHKTYREQDVSQENLQDIPNKCSMKFFFDLWLAMNMIKAEACLITVLGWIQQYYARIII